MFERLTNDLLDLTAKAKGGRAAYFAYFVSCCSSCCCCGPRAPRDD